MEAMRPVAGWGQRAPLTVLILTRNESDFIERAIAGVAWADEILVIDSESEDDTVEKARSLGARVVVQRWLGWLPQKEIGLRAASHDWILSLDADEIVTAALGDSIRRALAARPDPADGFVVERREEFLGELMPNARRRAKRDTFVRLFNRTRSGWDPDLIVHEEIVCPGRLHRLDGDLLHWRNYQIGRQLDTLNRNADLEARMLAERLSPGRLASGMVIKPVLRFLWIYVRSGFWQKGYRGFVAASLHAFAEFLRHAKAWEARSVPRRLHPPPDLWRPEAASGPAPAGDVPHDAER